MALLLQFLRNQVEMVETQMDQEKTQVEGAIVKLPVPEVENDDNEENLEDSSSIMYSELDDEEEEEIHTSELPDSNVVAQSSHAFYGYEDAAPQIQQRNAQKKPYRRNSIVDQIMTWAGAIRDDDFYNNSNSVISNDKTNSREALSSRRASVHGGTPTTTYGTTITNPLRQRVASSDDVALLDHDDGFEQGDDWNLEDDDDEDDIRNRRLYDQATRRNSLHAMVERAMAHVNLTQNYDDDDLTPFGNRRDSLF